jgi:hypothetical protein
MRKLLVITALLLFAGIAFGQTLKKGGMIAVHVMTITLGPDVSMNQYLDFLNNKWYPQLNKLAEGVTFFALKGDRGENANSYATLVYSESEDVRNKYWPGDGSDTGEWSAVLQKTQPLYDELQKLGTYTTVFTAWKIF